MLFILCRLASQDSWKSAWIGLSKTVDQCGNSDDEFDLDCHRRGWVWADGTTYNNSLFHDWQGDDPDPGELCVRLTGAPVDNHGWYGWSCSTANWYICQEFEGNFLVTLIE